MPERIDNHEQPNPCSTALRVVTWNIHACFGNDPSGEGRRVPSDPAAIAAVLRDMDADIVALQEVDRGMARSSRENQPELLANALGMTATFAPNLVNGSEEYGIAILTRQSILETEHIRYPVHEGWEPRGALRVRLDVAPEVSITVFCTHLSVDEQGTEASSLRREQATILADLVAACNSPVLVCGDFNAEPGDHSISPMRSLTDSWTAGMGDGFTIPSHPLRPAERRIDYIFHTPDLACERVYVVRTPATELASDHFPVMAEFRMRGDG